MKFKKVKKIPFQGNAAKNLIKRQLYAKTMLGVLSTDARVINCDETWINELGKL